MTREIFDSFLKDQNIKEYRVAYRNINYNQFTSVHAFPNTLFLIERIRLYGKTDLTTLNTGQFVVPVINNTAHNITNSISISKIQKSGSDYLMEIVSDEILTGTTKLSFELNNLLLTEVYRGYARIIEIFPND